MCENKYSDLQSSHSERKLSEKKNIVSVRPKRGQENLTWKH